jgi:hypothetical protein
MESASRKFAKTVDSSSFKQEIFMASFARQSASQGPFTFGFTNKGKLHCMLDKEDLSRMLRRESPLGENLKRASKRESLLRASSDNFTAWFEIRRRCLEEILTTHVADSVRECVSQSQMAFELRK